MKQTELRQEIKQFYDQDDVVEQWFLIEDDYEKWVVISHNNETLSMSLENWKKLVKMANKVIIKHGYSEEEVIELLQKALTHKDDGEIGSLVTAQGEIRTANFFSWFEQIKNK
jgi:hypothetical protein